MEEPTDRPLGPAIERRLEEILARVAADLGIPRDDIDPMAERFVLGFTHRGHVSAAELVALRDEGARAARAGVPISRKVDVVLTTSWVMLEAAAAAGREGLGADADERIKRSLTDAIATTTMRLDNLKSAETNNQFVELELERIEAKILALSEMSVNNQNPDFISTQVDSVAETMTHAEHAIRDLNALTGLSSNIEQAPRMLVEQ